MSVTLEDIKKHYWACATCLEEAGGKFRDDHITVIYDKCGVCGKENQTLIPWVDLSWAFSEKDNLIAAVTRD